MNETFNLYCLLFTLLWIGLPSFLIYYCIKNYSTIQQKRLDHEHELAIKKMNHLKKQNRHIEEANKLNKQAEHVKYIIEQDFKKEGNKPDIEKYIKELNNIYKNNSQSNA